jgi:hypothetical protein
VAFHPNEVLQGGAQIVGFAPEPVARQQDRPEDGYLVVLSHKPPAFMGLSRMTNNLRTTLET